MRTTQERFNQKYRVDPSGCWEWVAFKTKRSGYGQFWDGATMIHAHRASWILYRGPLPEGLYVCHYCDNPGCVNPDHLFIGDQDANMKDMVSKGRQSRAMGRKGEAHAGAKLTEKQVYYIRSKVSQGATQRAVALAFGVSQPSVSNIMNRKNWDHV